MIKSFVFLFLSLVCAALSGPLAYAQNESGFRVVREIAIRTDSAASRGDLFVNTYTGATVPDGCVAGHWCRVMVSSYGLPEDTKAIFVSGILIITHGMKSETADLQVGFRAAGDNNDPAKVVPGGVWYSAQSVEAAIGNGQRSTMASWIPVRNGAFEFKWTRSTSGSWPESSSYGINLTFQAFAR